VTGKLRVQNVNGKRQQATWQARHACRYLGKPSPVFELDGARVIGEAGVIDTSTNIARAAKASDGTGRPRRCESSLKLNRGDRARPEREKRRGDYSDMRARQA